MKAAAIFLIIFFFGSIICQTLLSSNTQTSSSSVNGVTTTTTTVTNVYNNGSTVVTRTVNNGGSISTTVSVTTNGVTTNFGPGGSPSTPTATLISSSTQTSSSSVNGVLTMTTVITNGYNNGSTVVTTTVTTNGALTSGRMEVRTGNTITTFIFAGNPSTPSTPAPNTPAPNTPAPNTPAPNTPAPNTPAPNTPAPNTPAPNTPAPNTPAPSTGGAQNPITLPSDDPYSKFNYKVPASISYDDIKRVHMDYINNARTCVGLPALTWDDALAAHAQAWANTCNVYHANGNTAPANPMGLSAEIGEGENIYQFGGSSVTPISAMESGNSFFNKEASVFNCDSNTCSGVCGHYTQNTWYNTTRLGCGVAVCGGSFYGVCRYFPRGNFNNLHPFGGAQNCNRGQGFASCKSRIAANGRSLGSTTNTQSTTTNKSTPFFTSDSQVVVFALAIAIAVVVVAILVVLIVVAKRRTANRDLEYQLLETK